MSTNDTTQNTIDATATEIPDNAAAQARAWWNKNHPDAPLAERGMVAPAILIEWTLAGMPKDPTVKAKGAKSNYTFAKGERAIFREWCEETGRDAETEKAKADWFAQDKPKASTYGIAAIITARKINKDGSLSKAKSVDFYVTREALEAHRTTKQGRIPAMDYVSAAADQLDGFAPVRIATRTAQGEGETHHAVVEAGDDGSEFTTAGNWVSSGNERKRKEREAAEAAEKAKDETISNQAAQLDAQAARLAEMEAKLNALLEAQSNTN